MRALVAFVATLSFLGSLGDSPRVRDWQGKTASALSSRQALVQEAQR
jgi:hypothetical protein